MGCDKTRWPHTPPNKSIIRNLVQYNTVYFLIRLPSLTNALLHCSKREDLSHSWLPSSTNLVSPVIVGSGSSLIFSRTFVKKWISLIESHCRQRSWEWGHVSPLIVTVFPLNPCISKPCHFLSVSCQSLFYISLWIFETATERTSCCECARWHTCIFKPPVRSSEKRCPRDV